MTSSLFVVRHGESENNVLGIDASSLETKHLYGLTDHGKQSVEQHARYHRFDIIYSSPLRRAKETADIFAITSNCSVVIDNRLLELQYGDFDLQPYGSAPYSEAEMYADKSLQLPNGENYQQFEARLLSFIEDIANQNKAHATLLVTHGPCLDVLLKNFGVEVDWKTYRISDEYTRNIFPLSVDN